MTIVDARTNLWEVLAGRAPGTPSGPADPGLWQAVTDRLNPARATPRLRKGIEVAHLTSARGGAYVMLRSPDRADPCYVRLTPQEWALAELMDGTRTVARLVAEFARITGRLCPEQLTRVVADLAANRMLAELPVDVFTPLLAVPRRAKVTRVALDVVRGRRVVLAGVDPLVGFLYAAGGRLLFTKVAAGLAAVVALAGLVAFGMLWFRGDRSVFLTGDSYLAGALVLLGLNVVALACHELGHALAVKHSGRRVPVAGVLVYFGIPSVFVDTTDVWMAGRRARIVTTAAGPASGLLLAGVASLVALAVPPLAPWAFKLAFAWYLNALVNLNPFLALDGYYLLMDALEVPNLRARGLAWVGARLRRRPPRFGELDREGRLIALYGMCAVAWLVIAANLAWRIYQDRVAGLVTGLWHGGWAGRGLLLAVVLGLSAPLVYVLGGHAVRAWRRWRLRVARTRTELDLPRRLDALRASALAGLSPQALTELARHARWSQPSSGRPLVGRGEPMRHVYLVVDGLAEARRPGDPGGVLRQRVGAGGLIGLANAVTGNPSSLAWYTVGATLLALPAGLLVASLGPLPSPPPAELAELEDLLDEVPQFSTLSAEAYLALTARAECVQLAPGASLVLPGPSDAALVSSGALDRFDGAQVRRGDVFGPFGDDGPGAAAVARTPARVWRLPALASLSPLPVPRAALGGAGAVHRGPVAGVHPPAAYPPLAVPPGPPPPDLDAGADERFERRLWWLLVLLLALALLLGAANLRPGPAWAEMPTDRALLTVVTGSAGAEIDGAAVGLDAGDRRYVGAGDVVRVAHRSSARLVLRGGSVTVLCAGTTVAVDALTSRPGHPVRPVGTLRLDGGRLLADTAATSGAFRPAVLTVRTDAGALLTEGRVRFAAEPRAVQVGSGSLTLRGARLTPTGATPACGDGTALPVGAGGDRRAEPSLMTAGAPQVSPSESSASPSAPASASASPSATRSATRSAARSTAPVVVPPTIVPTPAGPTSTSTLTPSPSAAPRSTPVIGDLSVSPAVLCNDHGWSVNFTVRDADDPTDRLTFRVTFTVPQHSPGASTETDVTGDSVSAWMPALFIDAESAQVTVRVSVTDDDANTAVRTVAVPWWSSCRNDG